MCSVTVCMTLGTHTWLRHAHTEREVLVEPERHRLQLCPAPANRLLARSLPTWLLSSSSSSITASNVSSIPAHLAVGGCCARPEAYIRCQCIIHLACLGVTEHIKGRLQGGKRLAAAALVWM